VLPKIYNNTVVQTRALLMEKYNQLHRSIAEKAAIEQGWARLDIEPSFNHLCSLHKELKELTNELASKQEVVTIVNERMKLVSVFSTKKNFYCTCLFGQLLFFFLFFCGVRLCINNIFA
jgi:hypothetical protein